MGNIIDGRSIAASIRTRLRDDIAHSGITPGLGIVLVGDHPPSRIYVARKRAACAEVGIRAEIIERPVGIGMDDLLSEIRQLNTRPDIHGIIVQRPLPPQLNGFAVASAIAREKDVDCLHPENVGLLLLGHPRFVPPTPKGIRELLIRSGNNPTGRRVVIVGRGPLVGRPLAVLLAQHGAGGDATVTVCHRATPDLAAITRTADILAVAIGSPGLITATMVRAGSVVIDAGINRITDPTAPNGTRIVGDVAPSAYEVAGAYTPVPGGVGPMTVAMLLENVVEATQQRHRASL
ncbi:bifunctional 5,10-methylenetetrahydrofolate dehydrogenase/5,10-methenyltetrahydrofolate cyclohydrolase [Candidatus Uhrbacteria bacterium]|nr:bifunctional 5,10-methylenetetrahydrofolate dehydrogenase/5,10-methenyltetrahydrofolate cyclohydrolase [Candidatus Uhrbacteria bacterium]